MTTGLFLGVADVTKKSLSPKRDGRLMRERPVCLLVIEEGIWRL
jgi:hypothetical protein